MKVIAALLLAFLGQFAYAQMTTITASQIQNNVSGQLLSTGYFELIPVNAAGQPTGFTSGAGGQVLPIAKFWPISNGAISGVVVPDTSLTVPSNIGYQVTITDTSKITLYTFGQPIHPTGSTWNFDTWAPTSTVYASPANAVQNSTIAPTGPCTAPSIFYYGSTGSSQTLTLCVGGVYRTFSTAGGMVYPSGNGIPEVTGGNSWGSTIAAPAGTIVGTTDTQTLTNKTVDGLAPGVFGYLASGYAVNGNTDLRGRLTLSSGTVTYTFAGTYTFAPVCTASDTTTKAGVQVTTTTTTLTIGGTGSDGVTYICAE